MRLRARLVVGVLATAVPLSVLLVSVQMRFERREREARVAEVALARMDVVGRARCESDPAGFPELPGEPVDDFFFADEALPPRDVRDPDAPRVFALDATFRGATPSAPRLDERSVRALRRGAEVSQRIVPGRRPRERTVVRMPWSGGPCAFVLVDRPLPPRPPGALRLLPSLALALAVALAMLVVTGPIVRRIRTLTEAVRRGQASRLVPTGGDEITELGHAFVAREARIAAQMDELARRERTLREYVANTTHDVAIPLTVLSGCLDAIDRARAEGCAPEAAAVRTAIEEGHYLAALLSNLNARARLEANLARLDDPVDLVALVARVVGRHAPIAERAGIALEHAVPEAPVSVRGDVTLLEQAVSNLVHNAVRHHREGGHVAVVLEAREGRFDLEVIDDGPGLSDEALARLGERGFRTDEARTRHPEGSGLGAHIAREVAERHGFTLDFTRNEPVGLRVALRGRLA